MLEPVMSLTIEGILTEGKIVAPEDVADSLEQLYQNPVLLKEMSLAARRNASKPEYRWNILPSNGTNFFNPS